MDFCVMYENRDRDLLKQMAAYRGGGCNDNAAKVASYIKEQRQERTKKAAEREQKKIAKEKAAKEKEAKAAAKARTKKQQVGSAPRTKKQQVGSAPERRLAQPNTKKQAVPPCAASGARPRPKCVAKDAHHTTEEELFGCSGSDSDSECESIWTSSREKVARLWARGAASGSAKAVKA